MTRVMEPGRSIQLEAQDPLERRREWRAWKPKGYRVLDADGVTVWHEHEAIRRLVLETFHDCEAEVFLFGSRAAGQARARSDYDVGFLAEAPPAAGQLAALRERLEELPIPSRVELVDFREVPDVFVEAVRKRKDIQIWKTRPGKSSFTSP